MFTGIVEAVSKVVRVRPSKEGLLVWVAGPKGWKIKEGQSINVSGVCSTVKEAGSSISFYYMPETLDKTSFGGLQAGDEVNLERSLRADSRLDGHIVQGHVDTVAQILGIRRRGDSYLVNFGFDKSDKESGRLLATKGSVAVDGISLTIVEVTKAGFSVSLIPYTLQHTTFHKKKVGDVANIEFDIIAKYLSRFINR
jgi:riboflavin synthase